MRVAVKGISLERIECRNTDGTWLPLQPEASYTLATNDYVARKCSKYQALFAARSAIEIEPDVRFAERDEFVAIGVKLPVAITASLAGLDEPRWLFG